MEFQLPAPPHMGGPIPVSIADQNGDQSFLQALTGPPEEMPGLHPGHPFPPHPFGPGMPGPPGMGLVL